MVSVTKMFSPWVTVVFAAVAAPFTLLIASLILSWPVPPMSVALMTPFVLDALPPITFLTDSAVLNSWPPLTASWLLAATLPSTTLMILAPLASKPLALTWPVKTGASAKSNVTLLPVLTAVRLESLELIVCTAVSALPRLVLVAALRSTA